MTQDYSSVDVTATDNFFRTTKIAGLKKQAPGNDFRAAVPPYGLHRGLVPGTNVVATIIILNDFSGGSGQLFGPYSAYSNRYWQSVAVDASYPGYLLPAQLTTATSNVASSGGTVGIHGVNAFSTLIWGMGGTDDKALWKETGSTDPTPAAITGSGTAGRPGASITGLYPIIIGGATSAIQVLECIVGTKPKLITDSSGTVNSTALDDAWNPTWWMCQTSLPGNPIIHQSGTSIYNSLTAASAITDTPSAATGLSGNVRAGGFLIGKGEYQLGNTYPRVWFVEPNVSNTSGMLALAGEALGQVNSVNLEGTDKQKFTFYNMPNGVLQAIYVNSPTGGAIVATDGKRVCMHDGNIETNLRLAEALTANTSTSLGQITSGKTHNIRGFSQKGSDLFAFVNSLSAADTTILTVWRYNWDGNTWDKISEALAVGAGANTTVLSSTGMPVSFNTGFVQTGNVVTGLSSAAFDRMFLTTQDENPYILYRRTSGAGSSTGNQYAAGTTSTGLLSPIWSLDGLEGLPSVVEGIVIGGDPWAANATTDGMYVAVYGDSPTSPGDLERGLTRANGVEAYFYANERYGSPNTFDKFKMNTSVFHNLQVQISPILTNGVRYASNCLPVYIHILTFLDGDAAVVSPGEVRAAQVALQTAQMQARASRQK